MFGRIRSGYTRYIAHFVKDLPRSGDCGPARGWVEPGWPISLSYDELRPGPVHQKLISWTVARSRPSNFQSMGPGLKIQDPVRPGPYHSGGFRSGSGRPMTLAATPVGLALCWPVRRIRGLARRFLLGRPSGRPMCRPVLKHARLWADVHVLFTNS